MKKAKKAKSVAVVKSSEKSKLMWAGGIQLLNKSQNADVQRTKEDIILIAKVLNITPFGINFLGGIPYINKIGRKDKLDQYGKSKWQVSYRWPQRSRTDADKALCEACVVNEKGKRISEWVIGECSPASTKMGTLKGYQNHIAQTRAHNRVIEEFIGIRIHKEMIENIAKIGRETGQNIPVIDTTVSAEEINLKQENNSRIEYSGSYKVEKKQTVNYLEQVKKRLYNLGGTTEKKALKVLKRETGLVWENFKVTPKQAQIALGFLLNNQ